MSIKRDGTQIPSTGKVSRAMSVRAFTLIEMLVVISIITLLLAILIPALGAARRSAKTVVCASNMKTITMEFGFFADGTSARGQGDSEALTGNRFRINDFQDSLYNLDEFWEMGASTSGRLSADETKAMCPAGVYQMQKRKGLPCGREAVGPIEDVSMALNMRLYRAVFTIKGKTILASPSTTVVSPRTVSSPYAPLVMDVDGKAAATQGVEPFYITPPLPGAEDPYSNGRYWSPSKRHGAKTVVGFIGGHVLTSADPAAEHWDWSHQAEVGR